MSGLSGGDGGGGGGVVRVISARFRVRLLAGLPGRLGAQALIYFLLLVEQHITGQNRRTVLTGRWIPNLPSGARTSSAGQVHSSTQIAEIHHKRWVKARRREKLEEAAKNSWAQMATVAGSTPKE